MRSSLKPTPWINKNNHHGASEVQISFKYDQRWSLTLRFTPYTHTPPWSRSFPSSESLNWTSSSKWTTLRWIHYVLKPSCHCGGGYIEGGGRGFSQVAEQRGVIFPVWHIYTIRAVNPPLTLVEHDGLWILVHHLGHVTQNVLLGDDAQETPAEEGCKQRSEVVAHVMSKGRMCRLEETNWNCNQISLTATLITQINQLQEKVESKTQLPLLLLFLAETAKHGHCGLDHKVSWPLNTSWPLI